MGNSPLVTHINLSPHCNKPRKYKIDTITIHHMAGTGTVESCGAIFANPIRNGSSNYGVDGKGNIGLYVEEANRAWTSSSGDNDHRAVTIEVANTSLEPPYPVSDKALESLIKLCADICKRNGIPKLLWRNDKSLIGQIDKQNMTLHRWFAATICPGDYLIGKMGYIADEVNKILGVDNMSNKDKPSEWAKEDWEFAKSLGITDGTRPHDPITREEAVVMILRGLGIAESTLKGDVSK